MEAVFGQWRGEEAGNRSKRALDVESVLDVIEEAGSNVGGGSGHLQVGRIIGG